MYKEKMKGYLIGPFMNLSKWIKNYFLSKPKFNKMLVLYGESSIGKTYFHSVLFN